MKNIKLTYCLVLAALTSTAGCARGGGADYRDSGWYKEAMAKSEQQDAEKHTPAGTDDAAAPVKEPHGTATSEVPEDPAVTDAKQWVAAREQADRDKTTRRLAAEAEENAQRARVAAEEHFARGERAREAERDADAAAEEAKCNAKPRCADARAAAGPLCDTIEALRQARRDMNRERSNPSGFVDKVLLHELGETIQDANERLPGLRAEFVKARKKPFNEAMCSTTK